ncbi:membrane integrity lipid transport subunit YebS [Serratia rhizosphaerae]|uniref:membrane integrity lipid transport subunit YebS n=1 Tax=unclassified Serratia (in: enterobacteria) TaxID=2647522 RepID=UPI000DA2F7CA|nr:MULTISPECIES: membrane integrity lipid transport subunit YebS [unclassified Serratia (in: enterobacteria)]MBU3891177.1 membrane integrity lipid transport subunit YebS [Serratia rubidaea]QNK30758.1 membrane integrity lipid transport subunit YebS [Serratia sp. JUb9]QPT15378.1 membrane integrity lipid transport subunit YebS [Serratia rubidaea]CAE1145434.1 Intermembrane transport protein YebS [Serratia sp. Tan611]SQJ20492.1 Inner membrane protein yebS [Serratia rubidaea]
MKIQAITAPLSKARYQRCCECDLLFRLPALNGGQAAYCPRCNAKVVNGRDWSMARLTAMAVTMLLLMPFAFAEPLINIRLLGTPIHASLLEGIWQMSRQGDPITASMVAFCTIGAPLTLALSLLYLRIGHRLGMNLRPVLLMLERLKEWVMLDIYLIGMAVAAIKVKEYADIEAGNALLAYLALTLLSILTLIHMNLEQLWERYYPQHQPEGAPNALHVCLSCHFTGYPDARGRCPRCHIPMCHRQPHSLQKTWAALIAAMILLLPANLLPISIIYANGARMEDTIFSGVVSLATSGNMPIAAIVFIASVLVPFTKVIVLITLLFSIHFKTCHSLKTRIRLLRLVKWIGRWSMLDLFVIALMMSLVNREQLLSFTMGPAAFYFGSAVILTILAVEWLDSRLIWDAHATGNAEYAD